MLLFGTNQNEKEYKNNIKIHGLKIKIITRGTVECVRLLDTLRPISNNPLKKKKNLH